MVEAEESDGLISLTGPIVRLEFRRLGDSWAHRIVFSETSRPLATSVEPQPDRDDSLNLASPSYQEVRLLNSGLAVSGVVAAIGRFGPHHFATTFNLTDNSPDEVGYWSGFLKVDIADRCSSASRHVAATYTLHAPPTAIAWANEVGAAWDFGREGGPKLTFKLEPVIAGGERVCISEAGRGACSAQVSVAVPDSSKTARLSYSFHAVVDRRIPGRLR
jgi:hypothetical protein